MRSLDCCGTRSVAGLDAVGARSIGSLAGWHCFPPEAARWHGSTFVRLVAHDILPVVSFREGDGAVEIRECQADRTIGIFGCGPAHKRLDGRRPGRLKLEYPMLPPDWSGGVGRASWPVDQRCRQVWRCQVSSGDLRSKRWAVVSFHHDVPLFGLRHRRRYRRRCTGRHSAAGSASSLSPLPGSPRASVSSALSSFWNVIF